MLCAQWWGITPLEYLGKPREERLQMLAVYDAMHKVDFLAAEQARVQSEREANRNRVPLRR